jgi:hypothetical protein
MEEQRKRWSSRHTLRNGALGENWGNGMGVEQIKEMRIN